MVELMWMHRPAGRPDGIGTVLFASLDLRLRRWFSGEQQPLLFVEDSVTSRERRVEWRWGYSMSEEVFAA